MRPHRVEYWLNAKPDDPVVFTAQVAAVCAVYQPMVLVSCKLIGLVGLIVMVMHFLQAGRKRETLPGMEEHMTTIDFITALFCQVDDPLAGLPKHPHATLWPSEIVTLGILHALKGVGNRAFYRWLTRDYRALFPYGQKTHAALRV